MIRNSYLTGCTQLEALVQRMHRDGPRRDLPVSYGHAVFLNRRYRTKNVMCYRLLHPLM